MNGGFRRSMAWLHTWAGLLFGWAILVILVTGSLAVFEQAITDWMRAAESGPWAADAGVRRWSRGGEHFTRLHYSFHADMAGIWAVGLITVAFLTVIVTGVITHARIIRDVFTFRPGMGLRSWLDAHAVLGVMTLPFLVMIAYTGLALFHVTYMPAGVLVHYDDYYGGYDAVVYGEETAATAETRRPVPALTSHPPLYAPVRQESAPRAARQTMVVLHLAGYGGAAVKWLYFLSGMAGAAGVAAGLHAFTCKRAQRHASGRWSRRLLGAVERMNCGVVAGLCVAAAAYFWSNRLLPAALDGPAELEILLFCAAWAACMIHAFARPAAAAWREQFAAAAALCAALPLLNALTSDIGLDRTLPAGRWALASVDLVALCMAAAFAWIALRIGAARRVAARRGGRPLRVSNAA